MFEWFWAYLTRERSARLITGDADELGEAMKFVRARSGTGGPEQKQVTATPERLDP
jgi:hypothetical protein